MKKAILSLSGGMDSSTLLLHLLANGYEVIALSFDYGQKHTLELSRAISLVKYLNEHQENVLEAHHGEQLHSLYPPIRHQIIKIDGLANLLNSSLVQGGKDVPEGHYAEENMKETVVPNRNKIFSSLIQAVALSVATQGEKEHVAIALGIHAGDHAIYPDCRQEFRDADFAAFAIGNWDSHLVSYYTPYLYTDKYGILKDGEVCCEKLGLDFNEVYIRTNTSYKPIFVQEPWTGLRQDAFKGNWYSDYKSASSVERIEAFIRLGRPDPVLYADETGPVTWDVAKAHAEKVLQEYHEANNSIDSDDLPF